MLTPTDRLVKLYEGLTMRGADVIMRRSHRDVPHLVGNNSKNVRYSIAFMGQKRLWRVFWPYPGRYQTRKDFSISESFGDIAKFLETLDAD